MGAVATHPKAEDFCRELALRALNNNDVVGVSIVAPTQNAELKSIGRYGPNDLADQLAQLQPEIELALREKFKESMRFAKVRAAEGKDSTVALIPGSPLGSSSGVLVIFLDTKPENFEIDQITQVALAFACDIYSAPHWSNGMNSQLRSKRSAVDEFGEIKITARQNQVLELMAEGKTNERIARALNYSVATIKNDIAAIFQFFGVNNRHDAIAEAEKRELLPSVLTR